MNDPRMLALPEWLKIGDGGVVPVQFELAKDSSGSLEGYASVFNTVDQSDDVVMPGAFKRSLEMLRKSGRRLPLTADHDMTADGIIGSAEVVREDAKGLFGKFDFASEDRAQKLRQKSIEGHLNGLSVYGAIRKASQRMLDRPIRMIEQVSLAAVGLTGWPDNPLAVAVAKTAVDTPDWGSITQADYTPEQWKRATIIDTGVGDPDAKDRYKLPVKTPGGVVHRGGVHAAAGRIGQVQVAADIKAAAARALVRMYRSDLNEDPPESLLQLAGMAASMSFDEFADSMTTALGLQLPVVRKAAVDALLSAYHPDGPAADTMTIDGSPPEDPDRGEAVDDPDGEPSTSTTLDEAAAYALNLVEPGPADKPPGSDLGPDPLADLLTPVDIASQDAELARLEADLRADLAEGT